MANNLRYLLEHFCLDGQTIDISSKLDEENANNIEKINTQTVPSINTRIDDIKNTDIPNINSRIDSIKNTDIPNINQKINTINNTTIPSIQENVSAVNEKADRINESVAKNTRDIGTLSDNVTMQGNSINSINTEKIPSIENNISELTTKVSTNTGTINELTAKVGTNTDSINELTTKVDTNTNSISELTTKVNTNTDSINTINNTSIPHLQSEIDKINSIKPWELIKETSITDSKKVIYNIKIYSNGIINYLYASCDFKNVTEPTISTPYGIVIDDITLSFTNVNQTSIVTHLYRNVGTFTIEQISNIFMATLMLSTLPNFTSSSIVTTGLFYF